LCGLSLCALAVMAACGRTDPAGQAAPAAPPPPSRPLARLEPARGVEFGVSLDWAHDSAAAVAERVGKAPAVYVAFTHLPMESDDEPALNRFIDEVQAQQGVALLTIEPTIALDRITPELAVDLADRLAQYNARGVPVLVRFAHEMNGSWYGWGQQPSAYRAAFRLIAEVVHARTSGTAMLWAPSYGAGYPFSGGRYEAGPGSADFAALDTNHDRVLDTRDDMYAPYYPGDDAVDWVGMTLYHWGDAWPWGKNIVPEPGKFVAQLTGTYHGAGGDQRGLPDFYAIYAERHAKPMAIPETAAFYNTRVGGVPELQIKQAWWRQVFGADVAQRFPAIKMINWFEWRKAEIEVNGAVVDWSVTLDPALRQAFRAELDAQPFLFALGSAATPAPMRSTHGPESSSPNADQSAAVVGETPTPISGGGERHIQFAGYTWRVRRSAVFEGPGPNYFSDGLQTVWVDENGWLHLRAAPGVDGRWYCAEVASLASLGHGTYRFTLGGRVDRLDPNVVLGLFTWSDDPAQYHRELDIEFGRFGDPAALPARYTVQPYTERGNVWPFALPGVPESTHALEWYADHVAFQSWRGQEEPPGEPGATISEHTFVRGIPQPGGEQVHLNLWLNAGRPPTDAQPPEVIVRNFTFTPASPDPVDTSAG
jgi:hypothetical protein